MQEAGDTENTRDRQRGECDVSEAGRLNKGKRNIERKAEKESPLSILGLFTWRRAISTE